VSSFRNLATTGLNALWYGGSPISWVLWPAHFLYRELMALRRLSYRKGWRKSVDVGVPVIVVGNLTVGGTGKTPLVIWLARELEARGFRVGIVCRGYRGNATDWPRAVDPASDPAAVGDEARLLAGRTGCPVMAGPDRAAAAAALLRVQGLDVILSDDGLQHYRLKRAFEIVVVDGSRGLGNGLCLPAGPLREPPSRLREADAVVINGGEFERSGALHAAVRCVGARELTTGTERPLTHFRGQSVHAVAAIGHPERFFDLLRGHGIDVDARPLADHAALGPDDLRFGDDRAIMMTEKDAVKCGTFSPGNAWAVVVELEFSSGDGDRLIGILMRGLERQPENQ
jgi:tetraacyldisaccharide 4'-kinase